MKTIDFSCKHDILLEDEEGNCYPMDYPYFKAEKIAEGTWKIRTDGDYCYLLEGDTEAMMIDSGYGAGNLRELAQTLTEKPVRWIANTHDHFDHTANNSYFECAYMSEETRPLATKPFPSFEGITFPRDYPVQILDDGDWIPLKGRELQAFKIADHAVGSLVFLDRKEKLLFSGDELGMPFGKALHGSVKRWADYMEKLLAIRGDYQQILGGFDHIPADIAERYLENAKYILAGNEGIPFEPGPFPGEERIDENGKRVWKRYIPHPGDGPKKQGDTKTLRLMEYAGCTIIYDIHKIEG